MVDTTTPAFSTFIAERTVDFVGREWVFAEIDEWLADPEGPPFFIITGEPGVGKSAIAARLVQMRPHLAQTPRLAAYHFCVARNGSTIDPLLFARSLSSQLCRYDGFAASILKESGIDLHAVVNIQANYGQAIAIQIENLTISPASAAEAFTHTVVEPLRALCSSDLAGPLLIVVDALDEAAQHLGRETIVSLLANARERPRQVRWLLTTRPEGAALRHFEQSQVPFLRLDAGRTENLDDIRRYVGHKIDAQPGFPARLAEQSLSRDALVERVIQASGGNFLYVVWLWRSIAEDVRHLDTAALPAGLDAVYREFMRTRRLGDDVHLWRTTYRPLPGAWSRLWMRQRRSLPGDCGRRPARAG